MTHPVTSRPCKHEPMRPDTCRFCANILRNENLAHLRSPLTAKTKTAVAKSLLPCIYRGEPTGEVRPCKTCGNKETTVALLSCQLHGKCAADKVVSDAEGKPVTICRLCTDRVVPKVEMKIPKIIHRIWVGNNPIPERFERYWATWVDKHSNWEGVGDRQFLAQQQEWQFRTWRDADIESFGPEIVRLCGECRNPAEMSDVLRFVILEQHGGVYVDTDFECLKNIEPLLGGHEFVAAWESDKIIASAFIACVPNHPVMKKMGDRLRAMSIDTATSQMKTAGPIALTELVKGQNVTILPSKLLYSLQYVDRNKTIKPPADAYAVHHWAHTWEDWWATITFVTDEVTAQNIKRIGKGDRITADDNHITTTHVCYLNPGERFVYDGVKRIRHALRNAPDYAENDFSFADSLGGRFWIQSVKHYGKPPVHIDGPPVLIRTPK